MALFVKIAHLLDDRIKANKIQQNCYDQILFTSQMRAKPKKLVIKCWIYNGDHGPEVYKIDQKGRLKDQENGRQVRSQHSPQPALPSTDARMQKLPDFPNTPLSPIGDVVTVPSHDEFNDTQPIDFAEVSNWFSESTPNISSSSTEWKTEVPVFFRDFDPDFELGWLQTD
jgi:hypothetical protein